MVVCVGCNSKSKEVINNKSSTETVSPRNNTEIQNSSKQTEKLKIPKTKKEREEAFGAVDDQGNWTPPKDSYIDPKTGNILNKDGVVVGTTREPSSIALPGSKG